ncbi:MAG: phosphoglucosamine mutase [Clostridiales bacterium]|jgi:phosphoglucosamine mutase|nr:phosphoglucosamine mutase [Clostridiales bacterium]
MGKLFGTDGVRGIANRELTPELAFQLGRAGAYALTKEMRHVPKIIVGLDTRISGGMLEAALTAGMCSMGARVFHAGVIPTPGIAYLVRQYALDAGVMISASHNPMQDNGIKFFNRAGYKLKDELENEIENLIESGLESLPSPTGAQVGVCENRAEAVADYEAFLKSTVDGLDLSGMKVAVDCANGATYQTAPKTLQDLGADVFPLFNEPDGLNINLNCGSTHMESLVDFVKKHHMDIGLALDGDGDRLLCVDEKGAVLDGDQIISICAQQLKNMGKLKKNAIAVTVMSNMGLLLLERKGFLVEKTDVGDRYVLENMLKNGYNLGGEQSGHIIFLDYNTTGDGMITALQLLRMMKEQNAPLSALNTVMEVMPQSLVNARVNSENKSHYMSTPKIQKMIQSLEEKYADEGRVFIRPSGTEPVIRVMIEGRGAAEIEKDAREMAALLEECLNA